MIMQFEKNLSENKYSRDSNFSSNLTREKKCFKAFEQIRLPNLKMGALSVESRDKMYMYTCTQRNVQEERRSQTVHVDTKSGM